MTKTSSLVQMRSWSQLVFGWGLLTLWWWWASHWVGFEWLADRYHLTGYADADEFALAAYVGGIVHPPAYPWYTRLLMLSVKLGGQPAVISWLAQWLTASLVWWWWLGRVQQRKIQWLGAALIAYWLSLPANLWHGVTSEVFAVNQLLVVCLLILTDKLRQEWRRHGRLPACWWRAWWLVLALGVTHQPVFQLFGLLIWFWLGRARLVQWLEAGLIVVVVWLVSYQQLILLKQAVPVYSWPIEDNLSSWWQVFTHEIYQTTGSAVETLTGQWQWSLIWHSWRQYWQAVLSQWWAVAWWPLMLCFTLSQKQWRKMWPYWLVAGLAGPGLLLYVKFPQIGVGDEGYFIGRVLRWRLLTQFDVLILWLGLAWLSRIVKNLPWWLSVWGVILSMAVSVMHWQEVRQARMVTDPTPVVKSVWQQVQTGDVLLVDADLVFSFLADQYINQSGMGVVILPSTWQMRWDFWHNTQVDYLGPSWPDPQLQTASLIAHNLSAGRQVWLYQPEVELLSLIGAGQQLWRLEGDFPLLRVVSPEQQISPRGCGTGWQSPVKTGTESWSDWWQAGWLGHLSILASLSAYYQVDPVLAQECWQLAEQWAQLASTQAELIRVRQTWRPVNWQTVDYRHLWLQAIAVGDRQAAYLAAIRGYLQTPDDAQFELYLRQMQNN